MASQKFKSFGLVALMLGLPVPAARAESRKALSQLEGFDISEAPSGPDWRYFIHATDAARESLWAYHDAKGQHLKAWSWGWRLGWVRACAQSVRPLCNRVLTEALLDKALVVRAEAATRIGQRYENSRDQRVIGLLSQAFLTGRNQRHGHPLFVQSRILYAIRQVGGDEALAKGRELSGTFPETRDYWARLETAERH